MNKKINKLIPDLRFPDFEKEGKWMEKALGEIGNFIGGGTPDTTVLDYWNGKVQWYTPTEVKEGILKRSNRTITELGLKNSSAKLLPKGALLITTRATIGDIGIAKEQCATNQGFQSLIVNQSEINTFWFYWISHHKNELIRRSSGSTFQEIGKNEITKIPTLSPKKAEQLKIASCLSSLDEVIAANSQKLEVLKGHKNGLLQNLFPQEGGTVPKLRFPEFEMEGEWEEKKLGEIGNFIGGGTPDTTVSEYWNGKVQWYTPTEVKEGVLKRSNRTITELGLKNSSAKLLPKGALLITTRATIGDIGIAEEQCTTNQGFQSLIVNKTEINTFWFYWVSHHKNELIRRSSGSTFQEIGKNEITKIPTLSPKKPEQQKIASCLSSLDDLIKAQNQKIEQLKVHKQGLMQGLFPVV